MIMRKAKSILLALLVISCVSARAEEKQEPKEMNCETAKKVVSLSFKEKEIFTKRVEFVDKAGFIVLARQYNALLLLERQAKTWITRNCDPA